MNDSGVSQDEAVAFDFVEHGRVAVSEYLKQREHFVNLAQVVQRIIRECLNRRSVKVNSVDSRAKDAASFEAKASSPSDKDPDVPKYRDPLREITDLAGVRVITFFPSTLDAVDRMIAEEFAIVERFDKGAALVEEERFGYQSIHYLVRLNELRRALPEYHDFRDDIIEVQVRTVLQHAWAEIEHDIQYKSASVIPTEIRRRFMVLAGLLELTDKEFQSIQDADSQITARARARVEGGNLDVEITPDALKAYLDRKLGPDGRLTRASYDWIARVLRSEGFRTLDQVESCVDGYSPDDVSQVAEGYRQGQASRFEHTLLAGMGEKFIERHPLAGESWFASRLARYLSRFMEKGIHVGDYDPLSPGVETTTQ